MLAVVNIKWAVLHKVKTLQRMRAAQYFNFSIFQYFNFYIVATHDDFAIFLGEEGEGTAIYCDMAIGRVCGGIYTRS